MSRVAVLLILALAGCEASETKPPPPGAASGDVDGWRFASGRRPSRAEYAAVVAACQDGAVRSARGKALDACLADLGLRKE